MFPASSSSPSSPHQGPAVTSVFTHLKESDLDRLRARERQLTDANWAVCVALFHPFLAGACSSNRLLTAAPPETHAANITFR